MNQLQWSTDEILWGTAGNQIIWGELASASGENLIAGLHVRASLKRGNAMARIILPSAEVGARAWFSSTNTGIRT